MGANPLSENFPPTMEVIHSPRFLVVDLFCGAGGTTIGFKLAKLREQLIALVIACVNHDPIAIKSHWKNNKEVKHFEEDIRTLDLTELIELVNIYRKKYPLAKLILWASLECTNFSKAKGGASRDPDSRTLADHLDRYIIALNPDYVMIENVVEFMSWGPMRIKSKGVKWDGLYFEGKKVEYSELAIVKNKKTKEPEYGWEPVSKKNGQDWLKWRERINELGYKNEWKELNSADYGAYTSRNRLFGVFHKPGMPAMFPIPTHAKKVSAVQTLFNPLQKWNAVKEVLNFKNEGESILNRLKPINHTKATKAMLKPGTKWAPEAVQQWILDKTIAKAKTALTKQKKCKVVILLPKGIANAHAHHPNSFHIIKEMLPDFEAIIADYIAHYGSVTFNWDDKLSDKTYERVYSGLVKYIAGGKDNFMQQLYAADSKGMNNYSTDNPARTITTRDGSAIVTADFISTYNSGNDDQRNISVEEPVGALTTSNRFSKIEASFITKPFSGKPDGKNIPLTGPAGTITCFGGQSLVEPEFLVQRNGGDPDTRTVDINGPARTLTTTGGNLELVSPEFIIASNGGNISGKVASVDNPSRVITTSDNKQLVQPAFISKYYSGDPESKNTSINDPAGTVLTKDTHALVQPCFLAKYYSSGGQLNSINEPGPTLTTKDRVVKIQTVFLDKQNTGPENHQSIDQPAGTIMPNDKHSMITTNWIDRNFSSGGQHSSIDDPAGTIMNVPKLNLVHAEKFIMPTNYDNTCSDIEAPLGTITANRKYHYLINPQFNNGGSSVNDPCFTLIAGMNKRPPYLVVTEEGELCIEVYTTDSEIVQKIKEFMALYGIADIKMRMLVVPELLAIQGFPADYKLLGTQADKKKFIGNSVVPHVVRCWAEQMALELERYFPGLYQYAA